MNSRERLSRPFGKGAPLAVVSPLGHRVDRTLNGSNLFTSGSQSLYSLSYNLGGREEVSRPYEENSTVHAALKILSEAVASVRLRLWASDDQDAPELPEGHELRVLFDQPNPWMSAPTFFGAGMIHRKLCGEDFWFMRNRNGKPIEQRGVFTETPATIQCVRGSLVEPKRWDENTMGWKYDGANGQEVLFPPWAVVHFRDYDPYNTTRGIGDVEALTRTLSLQFQAERYQEGILRNGGDPGGFIKYKGRLPPGEADRLEEEVNQDFSDPTNAGAWKVIDEDAEYVANKFGPRDMEYMEGLAWWRETILGVLGVPPPMLGILDDSSYNNFETSVRMLWTGGNGVISYLRTVEDTLDSYFFSKLADAKLRNVRARFDLSTIEALRADNTEKISKATELVARGVGISVNEALDMVGVDSGDLPMGETHYISPTLQIVNAEKSGDESAHLSVEQVVAVSTIVAQVAAGTLPRDAAFGMLTQLLGLSAEQAEAALGQAGTGAPTQPNKPEGAEEEDEDDEDADDEESDDEEDEDTPAPPFAASMDAPLLSARDLSILRGQSRDRWKEEFVRAKHKRVREPSEKDIFKNAKKFLRQYRTAQLKRIEDFAKNGTKAKGFDDYTVDKALTPAKIAKALMLDSAEWQAKMKRLLGKSLFRTYERALKHAAELLNDGIMIVSVSDPRIVTSLAAQEIQLVEGVTSTLAKAVRKAMVEVVASPGTNMSSMRLAVESKLRELKASVTDAFPDLTARARVIAHTEAGHADAVATFTAYDEAEIEYIEWISQGDDHVRESHRIDGETVEMGKERFRNGLLYPREPGGPAEEVIECRCDFAPANL